MSEKIDLGALQAAFNRTKSAKLQADTAFQRADAGRVRADEAFATAKAALEGGFRAVRG